MANINQKLKIYWSLSGEKDQYDIISEILEKNGIKENIDDALDKIEEGEPSAIDTVQTLLRAILLESISEKDFVSSLQKELKISKKASENILKSLKENVIPHAQIIKIGKDISPEENLPVSRPAGPIKKDIPEESIKEEAVPKPIQKTEEIRKKSRGPDSYRESIE